MEIATDYIERKCTFQEHIEMLFHRISFVKRLVARNTNVILKQFFNDISYNDIPEVSQSIIKNTLRKNNIQFEEGYTCFITACLICKHTKSATKLYINKTTGDLLSNNTQALLY